MAGAAPQMGAPYKVVRVQSIHANTAAVIDQLGVHQNVRTDYRRGGGPFPRVGERWIIDRSLGFWSFGALVVGAPPVISGSNDGIPALINLLAALDEAGLIVDQTTSDPLHSPLDHGHG